MRDFIGSLLLTKEKLLMHFQIMIIAFSFVWLAFSPSAFATGDCSNPPDGVVTLEEVNSAIGMFLGTTPVLGCVDEDYSGIVTIAEVQKTINSYLGIKTPTVLAGSGVAGYVDGTGTGAQFKFFNATVTTDGTNIYAANTKTVRQVTLAGVVTTIAGSSTSTDAVDGVGSSAHFLNCTGIAADDAGNLYVTDNLSHTIRKIVIATGVVTTIAGSAGQAAVIGEVNDGVGSAARFNQPMGIATDGTFLYVADYRYGAIRRIDLSSGAVTTVANVQAPKGIATDKGYLYVTDSINNVIYSIASSTSTPWDAVIIAGSLTQRPPDLKDGIGTAAHFNSPYGIAVSGDYLFVADSGNFAIRKINITTNEVTTITTLGSVIPTGITLIGSDIYLSNTNHTITKF